MAPQPLIRNCAFCICLLFIQANVSSILLVDNKTDNVYTTKQITQVHTAKTMKRRVRRKIRHREPLFGARRYGRACRTWSRSCVADCRCIGHDVSARHSAGVCWHSLRPLPRGSVRSKVVPRRSSTFVLDANASGTFFYA